MSADQVFDLGRPSSVVGLGISLARLRLVNTSVENSGLRTAHRGSGFTLIELLVVLAILGVLASLLLPTLARAKAKARSSNCQSNLRQLQNAWILYTDDNDGILPPNGSRKIEFDQVSTRGSWVVGNAKVDTNATGLQEGVLFPYLKSPAVYRCPSDQATVLDAPHLLRNRSYSMSLWLSPDIVSATAADFFSEADRRKLRSLSHLEAHGAARIWVFLDEHSVSLDDGVFIIHSISTNQPTVGNGRWWASFPGTLHHNSANLSFADGHVEQHRWRHHRAPTRYTGGPTPTQNEADQADLEWLQQGLAVGLNNEVGHGD